MAADLRILHLADTHIGADLPARPRHDRARRGDDFIDSFRRVMSRTLDPAADGKIDLVIHAGDVFNRSKPSSGAVSAAAEPILAAAVAGVPVVIVPGNHERSVLPASLWFAHENIHVVREPCTLEFRIKGVRVAVVGVPCVRRGAAERFPVALGEAGWRAAAADVNILAVHQTFESATCGPGNYRFRSDADVVERDAVPAAFDYVAAGHIHRHQVLASPHDGGPSIVYAGSPDRISFAEKDEPKGYVIIEAADGGLVHRFVEHRVRPMSILPMDVTALAHDEIRQRASALFEALPADAMAQLRLSGQTTADAMRGLGLAGLARDLRPQALITVSARAVEYMRGSGASVAGRRQHKSAFAALDASDREPLAVSIEDLASLPRQCGTYALYDSTGRLLYVGKAKNVRTRVRNHVSGTSATGFFSGWTREIHRVEVRIAYSELEALLVEADLIRKLRPPFNRQMRHWSRYRYLRENGRAHGRLEICNQPNNLNSPNSPNTEGRHYGPFSSAAHAEQLLEAVSALFATAYCPEDADRCGGRRLLPAPNGAELCERYFRGCCAGPCADRVAGREYEERLRRRDAFLSGQDDAALLDAAPLGNRRPKWAHL